MNSKIILLAAAVVATFVGLALADKPNKQNHNPHNIEDFAVVEPIPYHGEHHKSWCSLSYLSDEALIEEIIRRGYGCQGHVTYGGHGSHSQGSYGQGSYGQGSYGQGSYGQGGFGQGGLGHGSLGQGGLGQGGLGHGSLGQGGLGQGGLGHGSLGHGSQCKHGQNCQGHGGFGGHGGQGGFRPNRPHTKPLHGFKPSLHRGGIVKQHHPDLSLVGGSSHFGSHNLAESSKGSILAGGKILDIGHQESDHGEIEGTHKSIILNKDKTTIRDKGSSISEVDQFRGSSGHSDSGHLTFAEGGLAAEGASSRLESSKESDNEFGAAHVSD